jgi:hypothetical protein
MKQKHLYSPILNRQLLSAKSEPRMTKAEIDNISRALKAKVNAAKATILSHRTKLLAEFEGQMNLSYPPDGDAVWMDALNEVLKVYEIQRVRVEERCKELRIPERFRPRLTRPGWVSSWKSSGCDLGDYRAEMRKLANLQADDMIKSNLAKLETDSANIQYELAVHGCVTDAAKQFLADLPSIEALIPKIKVSEVEAMIEGRATDILPALLNAQKTVPQLPPSDEKAS